MSRNSSLPSQIPILPLYDQAVLFPGLLLRLRITGQNSSALLSHIVRSDQATLVNLVLGCVPIHPGSGLAGIIGDGGNERPALPAPKSTSPETNQESKPPVAEADYGCSARIKSLSRFDRSTGTSGYVLVVEGTGS
jgi:Lon protease-like protein